MCNQTRDVIQLITTGCPSHHPQNAQRYRPSRTIHHNNGVPKQQLKTDPMHGHAQVVVLLIFLWILDTLSNHMIRMGRQKMKLWRSEKLVKSTQIECITQP